MSITPFLSMSLLSAGAVISYFGQEPKEKEVKIAKEEKTKNKDEKSPKEPKPSNTAEKLDNFLFIIKMAKKSLKYCKKAAQQLKYILNSGIGSINFCDWIRSPKSIESAVLILGTIGMTYSNFKSFKKSPSFYSKVTTLGGSLLAESRSILAMHQLMMGLSDLAKKRKPPTKALSVAVAMIVANHLASRYSK